MRLRDEGFKTRYLGVGQPEKVGYVHRSFWNRELCYYVEINGY